MNPQLKSGFAQQIQDMLKFKIAMGHKIDSYSWNMQSFDRFCQGYFPDETILTKEIVLAWCDDMDRSNRSGYKLHAIRELGKYLVASGKEAFVLPSKLLPYVKVDLPYIFTEYELERFFNTCDQIHSCSKSPLWEYTIPTIFRLQYGCGLRPQEVRLLKRKDIDFRNGTIYILESKRRKDRRLAVNADLMRLCVKYDAIANLAIPNRTFFFQSADGQAYTHGWLTAQFHRFWKMSGNDNAKGPCVPYDFRHNFATQKLMKWVEEGKDLNVYIPYLSAYMGHTTFSGTYYYIHLLPERLSRMDFTQTNGIIPEVTP